VTTAIAAPIVAGGLAGVVGGSDRQVMAHRLFLLSAALPLRHHLANPEVNLTTPAPAHPGHTDRTRTSLRA
jgi:hypothetical protein